MTSDETVDKTGMRRGLVGAVIRTIIIRPFCRLAH